MESCCTYSSVVIFTIGLVILFGSSCSESSRVAPHQNVIVRKKLFSDIRPENIGGGKASSRRSPTAPPAAQNENVQNEPRFLPMVSPLYPAGAGPVAGLSAAQLGKDGSAPLLEQTSSSFDSDSADPDEWLRQRPHGPAGQSAHRPKEVRIR